MSVFQSKSLDYEVSYATPSPQNVAPDMVHSSANPSKLPYLAPTVSCDAQYQEVAPCENYSPRHNSCLDLRDKDFSKLIKALDMKCIRNHTSAISIPHQHAESDSLDRFVQFCEVGNQNIDQNSTSGLFKTCKNYKKKSWLFIDFNLLLQKDIGDL